MSEGKRPTIPWLDAMDLKELYGDNDGTTTYRWRDSDVRIKVNDETNEIVDIWEAN